MPAINSCPAFISYQHPKVIFLQVIKYFTTYSFYKWHPEAFLLTPVQFYILLMLCFSLSVRLTLCDPMDCSPPGSSVHGDSLGKNTRVSCHALLQGIFQTQELNPGLSHCRQILYHLSHQGSPHIVNNGSLSKPLEANVSKLLLVFSLHFISVDFSVFSKSQESDYYSCELFLFLYFSII